MIVRTRLLCVPLVLALATAAHADTRLKVKLTRAGGGKAAAGVTLVDASTTRVVAAAVLRPPFRTRLDAGPSTYYLAGDVVRFGRAVGGVSALFAVGDERKLRVVLPLVERPGASPAVATVVTRGAGAGQPVATMGPVLLIGPEGGETVDGAFLTVLFNETHDPCGLVWVDSSEYVLEVRQRDLDLQQQGLLNPLTPIRDERTLPTIRVEGTFFEDGTGVSGDLRLVDIATGQILASRHFEGRRRGFYSSYIEWGKQLALDLCNPPMPSSTTTTTVAGSTTTTFPGGCQTDADCGACSCCIDGVCGADGGFTQCCAPTAPPMVCGPKQPAMCPSDTTCAPPGQLGGNYYHCQGCSSGAILEWYAPLGSFDRSNCVRR